MQLDDTTQRLLAHLHRGGTFAYYWVVSHAKDAHGQAKDKRTIWYAASEGAPVPAEHNGVGPRHIYYGVHPVAAIPTKRTSATTGEIYTPRPEKVRPELSEIAVINALYGDFDAKDFPDGKAGAWARLEAVPRPASAVVDSGGGYQGLWLLNAPFVLDTPAKRERARRLQERWVAFIGSDPSVHDLPRVLRLPGAHNWKYDPAPLAEIVRADFDCLSTIDELEALIPPDEPKPAYTPGRSVTAYGRDHLRRWVDEVLERACTRVAHAPSGAGSDTRVEMGRLAGGVAYTNVYSDDELIAKLLPAALARSSDSAKETERNLRNGLAYGKLSDLTPPPFPTDQPILCDAAGIGHCPSCDTPVKGSKFDYPGTIERGWYCPTCKHPMVWPLEAYTPPQKAAARAGATESGQGEAGASEGARGGSDTTRQTQSERILGQLQAWGYAFRLNRAGNVLECNGQPMDDELAATIRTQYRDAGLKNIGALEDVYRAEARRNAYHPVRAYLESIVWDGQPHIARLATKFTSSDPDIVYPDNTTQPTPSVYLLRWLIGAVAKALDGKQNMMLVLGGKQRIGKSQFVRWLCSSLPDSFIEEPINPGDKDNDIRLITKWIWEVSELDATTRKADVAALKGFITKGEVTVRRAYARLDMHAPALASFIGTVNPSAGFLSDTENRRFHVTTITHLDWSYEDLAVDQVWAEAVMHYRRGVPHELLPCEVLHRDQVNTQHQVESILEGWIEKHFWLTGEPTDCMTAADIVDHLRSKDIRLNGSERGLAMELSRVLEHLKVTKVRTTTWRGYSGIAPRETI